MLSPLPVTNFNLNGIDIKVSHLNMGPEGFDGEKVKAVFNGDWKVLDDTGEVSGMMADEIISYCRRVFSHVSPNTESFETYFLLEEINHE